VREQGRADKAKGLTVWVDVGATKRPDVIVSEPPVQFAPRSVIIDAKYKWVSGKSITVGAGDQYQAFAYSMLRGVPNPGSQEIETPAPDTVALVFPLATEQGSRARLTGKPPPGASRGLVHGTVPSCHLLRVGLPFPSHDDTLSPDKWQTYLSEVGHALSSGELPRPT
jgi:hypothetical protein